MKNRKELTPPDLPAVLRSLLREAHTSINCVQIGTIQSFNAANQTATIKIAMKLVEKLDADGSKVLRDYPLLLECPVFILHGAGDAITFPIAAGDSCIILFNDRQIDQWLNFGEGLPPEVGRTHNISDGIALVGLKPYTASIAGYFTGGVRINHAGSAKIELSDALIESTAALFKQNGDAETTGDTLIKGNETVEGNFQVDGSFGGAGAAHFNENVLMDKDLRVDDDVSAGTLNADNGATGTFSTVTVVNGIVIGGTP